MSDPFVYFWFLCGAWVGGGSAAYYHVALKNYVATGQIDEAFRSSTVRGCLLWIGIPCILLGVLQVSSITPLPPDYALWPSPQKWLALSINLILWGTLLWWVWLASGAPYLVRLFSLRTFPMQLTFTTERQARALSLFIVGAGLVKLFASWSRG